MLENQMVKHGARADVLKIDGGWNVEVRRSVEAKQLLGGWPQAGK